MNQGMGFRGKALAASGALAVGLWLLEIVSFAVPDSSARGLAMAGLVIYFALELPLVRRGTWIGAAVAILASALIALAVGKPALLLEGIEFAVVFPAFLATIALTRAAAEHHPLVARSRKSLAATTATTRAGSTMLGAHLCGSVITAGSLGVVEPLTPRNRCEDERVSAAAAAVRGTCLAVLWSPFFLGMAVTTRYLPQVPLWQITLCGLCLAGAALSAALWGFGRITPVAIPALLAPFRPVLLPLLAVAGLVVVLASATALGTFEAVFITLPPITALWAIRQRSDVRGEVVRRGWSNVCNIGDDLLQIGSVMIFSRVLAQSELANPVAGFIANSMLPPAFAYTSLLIAVVAAGICGLHPVATISVLLALLTDAAALADLPVALLGVIGWSLGTMNGPSALVVMLAASTYAVPLRRIAIGQNLAFVAVAVPVAGIFLAGLDALISL